MIHRRLDHYFLLVCLFLDIIGFGLLDCFDLFGFFGFETPYFFDIFDDYGKIWQERNDIHIILMFASLRKAEPKGSR
jgi:hypothetical protein